MDSARQIEKTGRAISAKEAGAATKFLALSGNARIKILEKLSRNGLRSLTRLIKDARKRSFTTANKRFCRIAAGPIETPVYLLDETLIEENMRIIRYVKDRTGCKVLHALKAYASFATFPMMSRYLDGTSASGLHEAKLGYEEFKKEVHTFGAAYREKELGHILKYSDAIIFNSFYQLQKYGEMAARSGVEIGLRVNPGHAEVGTAMYNPCAPYSRLGIVHDIFKQEFQKHKNIVDGLHFHALCQQNSDVLERILKSFEELYGQYLRGLKWVNFGGGHHITRDGYDLERLIKLIENFKKKYRLQVYLEPGEANVFNAGVLISTVLDIVKNKMEIVIMDTSPETHMPDVLLMPYRPDIMKSGLPNEKKYSYRLAGPSCLAGDVIGDYSFDKPLKIGDTLIFCDMALYSIVKSTTFNGINLPDIAVIRDGGKLEVLKKFGYNDYRNRQS
jgi:carboxynorspermidine decarboxylase